MKLSSSELCKSSNKTFQTAALGLCATLSLGMWEKVDKVEEIYSGDDSEFQTGKGEAKQWE